MYPVEEGGREKMRMRKMSVREATTPSKNPFINIDYLNFSKSS
jgi:hypothetical protein